MTRPRGKGKLSKAKTKNKGKANVEEVHAMGVKRATHEESSQGKEKMESNKNPTKPWHKIEISSFDMEKSFNPYDLVHNVCKKRPNIT